MEILLDKNNRREEISFLELENVLRKVNMVLIHKN